MDRPSVRPTPLPAPTRPNPPQVVWRPRPDNRPWQSGGNYGDWRPDRLPNWAQRPGVVNISNRWGTVVVRPALHNWQQARPDRMRYWSGWGGNVRHNWHWQNNTRYCFHADWWNTHFRPGVYPGYNNWHYGWSFNRYPWNYWWRTPTYAALTGWFVWNAPTNVWARPCYYDYGPGGNVYTTNNIVYVDGQQIGNVADDAAALAMLCSVAPPTSQQQLEQSEWSPLGTFAVSTGQSDMRPAWIVQLAVNRQGIVSGALYNTTANTAQSILGRVDPNSQRVAVRIGDSDLIVETGLYNLTQQEAPVVAHYGINRSEYWLLVRLDAPQGY